MHLRLTFMAAVCLIVFGAAAYGQEAVWTKYMNDAAKAASANQPAQAQALYEKALAEAQKFGTTDPRLDKTLLAMAKTYQDQKNWAKAETIYRQIAELRAQSLGTDHLAYAQSLNNLGVVLQLQGKYPEAEQDYLKALKIVESNLGPENRYSQYILENYAPLLRKTNRNAEAEKAEQRVREIRAAERALVASATPVEAASATVGIATAAPGRQTVVEDEPGQPPTPAGSASQTSLPSASRPMFFDQDVNEMLAMANLPYQYEGTATSYKDKGDERRAEKFYKMALEAAQLSSGPRSMQTVLMTGSLAMCYERQGKFSLAEPLFKRQLSIYAHMPELDEWRLGVYAKEYADILRKVGNNRLAAQVDEFSKHLDEWINSPSSRNASYCAWLQEEKPQESALFLAYKQDVQQRIRQRWSPPAGESYTPPVVVFEISRDGNIYHLEISHTSESLPVDQAALRAVSQAAPFPPLPPGTKFDVKVEYTFDRDGTCTIHHQ